ncbi:hypothetical protein K1T71_000941 [Dendrolimus kikuchii]|uniref:Uncharacterized protein n=1 Tax=Dendrolimus kikuchii TaxID=765133 RepID=A0ACC1DGM5_9NEOP|nr:hypothetical protein K1T71_000941 [Dendrolimus kikuchii]
MGYLEDRDFSDVPTIPEYFKDKTIFITGGTGFIGKVLIEKLLYSCTDLKRIYLLLRPKKGVSPHERLDQMYSIECFDRLRKEKPDVFKSKVQVICGDVMDDELGLSDSDKALLISKVNIVFHVAASVRFDDPLKYAVKLNLCGTIKVMELAKNIENLSSVVHVSTSYSNSHRDPIEEVMYPPLGNWRELIDIVHKVDDHTLRVLTSKILGEIPNTYTFTKQLAEHAVYELRGTLPVVIYRPSIVISSVNEPVPGWIDNFNGPVSLIVASAAGIMRSIHTDHTIKPDYIPVDMSVQGLIAAAWIRGTKKLGPTDDIEIYNCCAGNLNGISLGEMIEVGRDLVNEYPMEKAIWYRGGGITACKYYHYLMVYFCQLLPGILIDSILMLIGKKPMLVKIQRRILNATQALQYFVKQQWTFCNMNFVALRSSLKEKDKEHFYYNLEGVEPLSFLKTAGIGAKWFLLKEKMEDLPKAKAWNQKLKILDIFVKIIFYSCCLWWFINLVITKTFGGNLYDFIF